MGAGTASRTAAAPTAAKAPQPSFRAGTRDASARTSRAANATNTASGPAPVLQLGGGRQRALSGGSALAAHVLDRLERGFGADLSAVRVHEGADAARLAQAHGARAFAIGQHVVLGPGESSRDIGLMAHEVAHVLQQRGAAPAVQRCDGCCDCGGGGGALEGEAAAAAGSISSGGTFAVSGQLAAATPQYEGEDEGILSGLVWRTANAVAPQLVPIMRRGPEGVLDWIKDKVSGALQTVVDTAMAPVKTVTDSAKFLHSHIAPLLSSMQEAAARIAQNDCKPITDAAAKIEALATQLITPVIEKIQGVVGKVGNFLSGVWDRFGTPVWDFLKKYAGEKWRQVQQLIDWVWDLAKPVRDLSAKAWTWVKNKIGIGDGPEGQNGILQWVQAKAKTAWDWVQAKIEPYKKKIQAVLATVAAVAVLVSPAGPFVLAGIAIYGAIQGVKWIRANLAGGNALVRARAHAQTVLIPQMIAAINRMTAAVMKMAAAVTGKLGEFASGLGAMVGAAAGSALNFLVGAAQWLADKATELAAWATTKLSSLADWIQRAMSRLIAFLQPLLDFLAKVGALIVDVTQLPLLLAGALWKKIPACIRDPFVDWIVPLILRQIEIFKELVKNDEAWAKTKATVMRIVRAVFVTRDLKGAIRATFELLLQVFNLPIELLVQVKNKALAAWDVVSKAPIAFIKNAVKALGLGLQLYGAKLKDNLLAGLEGWLFGELADKGIAKPKSWTDPWDLVKLALDVLGLSMPHFFELLEKRFEKETVDKLRSAWRMLTSAWDWIMDMKAKKPGEVAKEIVQAGKEFGKSVLEGIVSWIMERVAIELTVMATAAAASAGLSEVVNAVRRIYRAIKTAVRWARQIVDMVNKTLDGVLDIAAGSLAGPAEIFNQAMKKATPAVIGFLGDQVGLSGVAETIKGLIDKLRLKVDNAILAVIDAVKGLFASIIAGAKSLAGKLLEWWKTKTPITAGTKRLTLITDGSEEEVQVAVAASPAKSWSDYIASLPDEAKALPEYQTALALVKKIQTKQPRITEKDDAKRDALKSARSKVLQDDINALVPLIKALNMVGDADTPTSVISYNGTGSDDGGGGMEASILSNKHPPGSEPGDFPPIWNKLAGLGAGLGVKVRGTWYVQGHLLNHNVGGPGKRFNLTPWGKQANNDHKNWVETDVKAAIEAGKVLNYTVTVQPAWGSLAIPRLSELEDKAKKGKANTDEVAEIDSLKALSTLTQGFVCNVQELKKSSDGKWVKKPAKEKPLVIRNKLIPNKIVSAGKVYGYP